jgi:hypothetical protein
VKTEEKSMSFKHPLLVGFLVIVSLATGIAAANAAETGTKTMPGSSIYSQGTPPPVIYFDEHYVCYLPSEPCDNEHRVQN